MSKTTEWENLLEAASPMLASSSLENVLRKEGDIEGEYDHMVFFFAMTIIWYHLAGVLWVENGFAQNMKIFALLVDIGEWTLNPKQVLYIFNTTTHLIVNLCDFIRQTHLDTSVKPGWKWRSQWKTEEIFYPDTQNQKHRSIACWMECRFFITH